MALIKLGAIVTDISGKLGGHVFAKNNGGAYMRTKTTPTNPQTAEQSAVRQIFGAIASNWSALTNEQRKSWNGAVEFFEKTNIFGDLKKPTGKALYQRINQNLAISGQTQLAVAPSSSAVPQGELKSAFFDAGVNMNLIIGGDSTGSKVQISATPPLSAGTSFVKNKLRVIKYVDGSASFLDNILPSYQSKFGAIVFPANIKVSVKFINSNGQASPSQLIDVQEA